MDKKGRNDPCPCGSGKKFKKCCESARSFGLRKYQLSEKGQEKQDVTSLFQRTFVPKEKNYRAQEIKTNFLGPFLDTQD